MQSCRSALTHGMFRCLSCGDLALRAMSRMLLQASAALTNATASPSPSSPSGSGSPGKSGVIYTFTFIGATVLVGLVFLGLMFRYIVKYRYRGPPFVQRLQASVSRCCCNKLHLLLPGPAWFSNFLSTCNKYLQKNKVQAAVVAHYSLTFTVCCSLLGPSQKRSTYQTFLTSKKLWSSAILMGKHILSSCIQALACPYRMQFHL